MRFEHVTSAQRVQFGTGSAAAMVRDEVTRLGASRVMLIAAGAETEVANAVTELIDVSVRFNDVVQHVPIENARAARRVAADSGADLLLSVGGGSTTGFAKAVAMTTGLPIIAVPTTYAGSEATNVWGLTEAEAKTTGVDDRVLPVTVIYDAALTFSLPLELTVASGINALAHCIDSMWAPRADPINQAFAAEGIRALTVALPLLVDDLLSVEGRERALYGAYLSAVAFASAGSGLHHKVCHVLGGAFGLPHAQTHAAVLPQILAFNGPFAPDAAERIRSAFGSQNALGGLYELYDRLHAPQSLRDIGFDRSKIDEAAGLILPAVPPTNPRAVTAQDLRAILDAAWEGRRE